jgi:hypothetical protein
MKTREANMAKTKWGTQVTTKTGKTVTLLNPQEKAQKFFKERTDYPDGNGVHLTNNLEVKTSEGCPIPLTDTEKSYRVGYENAVKDMNKLYRATHPEYKSKYGVGTKRKN